jgi:predicted dehydrogenase
VIKLGLAGLGYWGPNLARNFDDLADLAWLCDLSPDLRDRYSARYPHARATDNFDDLLEDPSVQAVVIATPVSTHHELARRALSAGKHVFVEKPPALSGTEADELVALAEERDLVLLPGHLLLYHPAVAKLQELIEAGELGDILYIYGNRQNLGQIRKDENALWSLGVHDLSVKVTVYDKGTEQRAESYGEWRTRTGDIYIPKIANDEPLRLECRHFLTLVAGDGDRLAAAREGATVVRVLEQLQASLERAPA